MFRKTMVVDVIPIFLILLLPVLFGLPFYHQDDYILEIDRAEVESYNKEYIRDLKYYFGWYNRSLRALNASGYLIRDVGTKFTGTVQAYKLLSNEYRYFPLTVGGNLCEEYKKNNFRAKELLANISNLHDCPLQKGYYYLRTNGVQPDMSTLPPFIPRGQYKGHVKVYHEGELVIEASVYATVKDKPVKWD